MIFLTQETGFLKPIAWLLGQIFNGLFNLVNLIGLPNVGLCVILFTIITRLIMLPLTIKQQKFSKLSNMMQPELMAIQEKYKDKKDNESMLKMNEETKAVYEKYGTSPSGGCLTMVIQLPIMFALYRVIYKIPGYVSKIKDVCVNIFNSYSGGIDGWKEILVNNGIIKEAFKGDSVNNFVDTIYNFSASTWEKVKAIPDLAQSASVIGDNADKLIHYNNFFGISLMENPGFHWSWALLIPVLAGLTQWLSFKLTESKDKLRNNNNDQNAMTGTMKAMNMIMPIMSVFFCITLPACIGLYWITSSVVQIIQQLFINAKMDHLDVEKMVQDNIDKVNAKRAKKGLPPKKITNTAIDYAEAVKKQEAREGRKAERDEEIKKSTEY